MFNKLKSDEMMFVGAVFGAVLLAASFALSSFKIEPFYRIPSIGYMAGSVFILVGFGIYLIAKINRR